MSELGLNKADAAEKQVGNPVESTIEQASIDKLHAALAKAYARMHAQIFYLALHQNCISENALATDTLGSCLRNTAFLLNENLKGTFDTQAVQRTANSWASRFGPGEAMTCMDAAVKLFQQRNPAYQVNVINKKTVGSSRLHTISQSAENSTIMVNAKDRNTGVDRVLSANEICVLYGIDSLVFEVSIPFYASQSQAGFKYLTLFRYIRALTSKARRVGLPLNFEISLYPHDRFLTPERRRLYWSVSSAKRDVAFLMAIKNSQLDEGLYRVSICVSCEGISNAEFSGKLPKPSSSNILYNTFKEQVELLEKQRQQQTQVEENNIHTRGLRNYYSLLFDHLPYSHMSGMASVTFESMTDNISPIIPARDTSLGLSTSELTKLASSCFGREVPEEELHRILGKLFLGVQFNPALLLYLDDLVQILESTTRHLGYVDPTTTLIPEQTA